jgi:hypothetical protein
MAVRANLADREYEAAAREFCRALKLTRDAELALREILATARRVGAAEERNRVEGWL